MKKILLIRHSYAENGSFEITDFERSLTKKGVEFAIEKAEKYAQNNFKPDVIISSDAKRALQTANLFANAFNYSNDIKFEHFLYEEYTTHEFLTFINKISSDYRVVAIVGHNPTIATIAYRLAPEFIGSVSPATIIEINFSINSWNEIQVGKGSLKGIY